MLSILLMLAAAAATPDEPPIHDGGVCTGLSWIHLAPDERVSIDRGPDFVVFRFHGLAGGTDHWWGVYGGNAAQVRGDGRLLLRRDGVTVHRATEGGKFSGYLAARGAWQNHFFGSVFDGSDHDRAFFDRIDFGPQGRVLCAKDRTGA